MSTENVLDDLAGAIDVRALSTEQFIHLLETLHILDAAGAGVSVSSISTKTLVRIVRDASKDQIRALGRHAELGPLFVDEIFRRMSEHFLPEKAQYVNLVVGWRITNGDDDYHRYQTVIEDGTCVSSTDLGRSPDTTITVAAEDFIRVTTGNAAVAAMFVTGKVKVKGDYAPAVRFSGYFDIPKPD